jgi:hypothetical protein
MIKLSNYTADNFVVQEFVPESVYKNLGDSSIAVINSKLIIIAQELRRLLNIELYYKYKRNIPLTINNWHTGGKFKNSGYRLPLTSVGAKFSQHKLGQAIDVRSNIPHWEIYNAIMRNKDFFYGLGVRRLEDPRDTKGKGFGWIHIDLKDKGQKEIITFKP